MHVHRSNRLERLVESLAALLRTSPLPPFVPEVIVVQSKGMERWLSLELAKRLDAFAHAEFPFPRAFFESCLSTVTTTGDRPEAYARPSLLWAVAAVLRDEDAVRGLPDVRAYLDGDATGRRWLELSEQVAHAFDQYAVYRPELLLEWLRDPARDWQAAIWRAVVERLGPGHLPGRVEQFLSEWTSPRAETAHLPRRVVVFGISSMPPLYVRLLATLSHRIETHLFYLCPAEHWAGDRRTDNALFTSLGKLARDFQRVLEEGAHYVEPDGNLFAEPGSGTILKTLQSDVLALRRRNTSGDGALPVPASPTDESVAVMSCHGEMREVEVLRDQLLASFEADPTLEPHDVVVMMPDVDKYAPLIDAVFGIDPEERGFLPYRVADRTLRSQNAVSDAFLATLTLLPSRMKASEVLDLLEHEPIRRRFGVSDGELPDVFRLVRRSGIRWGIDAEHRRTFRQPPTDANTWRLGLRRLLLGHAMTPEPLELFEGVAAYPHQETEDRDRVGRLSEFAETLFAMRERLLAARSVPAWCDSFTRALDDVTATEDPALWQTRDVRDALAAIAADAERAGFADPVGLEAILAVLRQRFERERTTHDFVSGGITFCAMLPMRSVPFRVVYLLGMNDADYPRRDRAASFDWITRAPRVGDRSVRDEDRHLFLEALLSARDRFIVSFIGRGVQDNATYPPSVVVAQLLDVIGQSFVAAGGGPRQLLLSFGEVDPAPPPAARLVVEHPLQPFSPRYFESRTAPLFSYSEQNLEGARALAAPAGQRQPFHTTPLVDLDDGACVDLDDLARFFENPARALLQRRLGVRLDDESDTQEDREPVALAPLDAYSVGSDVFETALRGVELEQDLDAGRALGVLPLGTPGAIDWESLRAEVLSVAARARPWMSGTELRPLDLTIDLGAITVTGTLHGLYPRALVRARFARLKPKNEVAAWVRHLALQCEDVADYPRATALVGRSLDDPSPCLRVYKPLEPARARDLLLALVRLYRLGQRAPLALFPNASKTYVEILKKSGATGGPLRAMSAAQRAFSGNEGSEAEDEYVSRLFSEVDPFGSAPVPFDDDGALGLPSFERAALMVFGPLLEHCLEESA